MCQSRGCTERASWRELDTYTQQGQTHAYFYYLCDEHKRKFESSCAPGHKKEYAKIA